MKRISKAALLLLLLAGGISSCKKDSSKNPANTSTGLNAVSAVSAPASPIDMWNFISGSCDARFKVRSFYHLETGTDEIDINGNFYDSRGNRVTGSPCRAAIGGFQLTPGLNNDYVYNGNGVASLFNSRVNFQLTSLNGASINNNLDVRSKLSLSSPVYNMSSISSNTLSAGTRIQWNADANNQWGIVIGIHYDPNHPQNAGFASQYPNHLATTHFTADNGSYSIAASDLSSFPRGAYVNFYIARGSYDDLIVSNADFRIIGWTAIGGTYVVQ